MNILVLTNIYPALDLEKENTPVVHYFTREWVKMGHNVQVVHYPANFPKLYMFLGKLFKKQISSKLGVPIRTSQTVEKEYEQDGVKVKRIPLLKYKLHSAFSKKQVSQAYLKTRKYLSDEGFTPDFIISHWVNPQLEIMERLKKDFQVPICYVAHTPTLEFTRIYNDYRAHQLIDNIDLIGFRSQHIKDVFLNRFGYKGPTFMCYSGIPEQYIPDRPVERPFDTVSKFVFVGTLIKRKHPAEIVPAVVKAFGNDDFEINYIGTGVEEKNVNKYAKELGVSEKVHLLGRMCRDEVVKHLEESDLFVMISRSEAFGLVYLEAMAQGCLTIASKNEGFDGIIQDGVNGFLCNAGDVDDLARTIKKVRKMSPTELMTVSTNAISTARSLTDVRAAKNYLFELENLLRIKQ